MECTCSCSRRGAMTFRFDYRLNGRRETVVIGRYGPTGVSPARAREKLLEAKKVVQEGRSPTIEKQSAKRTLKEAKSFGEFGERWLQEGRMADSTKAMRHAIYERDILPKFRKRLLTEILAEDLRALCAKVKERGAPATAIHVRDIVKQIFAFAILHGEKVQNPADEVGPASIATFQPKDLAPSPAEIKIMLLEIEHVPTLPTIRLGLRLILLTMVRKSELRDAVWDEVDFENAVSDCLGGRCRFVRPARRRLCRQRPSAPRAGARSSAQGHRHAATAPRTDPSFGSRLAILCD